MNNCSSRKTLLLKKWALMIFVLIFCLVTNVIPVVALDDQQILTDSFDAVSDTPLLKFTAMSDLHIDDLFVQSSTKNREQFKTALNYSYEKGYSDLFLCGGDVSSYGNTSEWQNTQKYINDAGFDHIVWALGNHAYGTLGTNTNAGEDFKKFIDSDTIYHHDLINGYDFICFGCERTDLLISDMVYSQAQENWIMAEIEETAKNADGKPIFVVSHYPIGRTRIAERLSKYNNIIFFYGHVHDADWESYTIDKYIDTSNNYTLVRVGSVTYGTSKAADTMLVDVYSDRVVLTLDRTEGKAISGSNSVTIYLTLPSWKVMTGNNCLYWYLPHRNDVLLCICAYNDDGKMRKVEIVPVSANMTEQWISDDCIKNEANVRLFFINSSYIPYGEATEIIR